MIRLATHAMGTRFEIVLPGENEQGLRAVGEEAIREIEEWHRRLSRFEPGSDTSRLNREPGARVDGEMAALLSLCDRVRVESDGAFDVRCGPNRSFDFGAVGKGWALDRAAAVLREHGVDQALLHGGTSSVITLGAPPGAGGWRIAIRSDGEPLDVVLNDQALGVSAPMGSREASSGDFIGTRSSPHILDPRTGLGAMCADTAAVIVPLDLENAGSFADVWSTTLIVTGSRPTCMSPDLESHIHTRSGGWSSHRPSIMESV